MARLFPSGMMIFFDISGFYFELLCTHVKMCFLKVSEIFL